MTRIHSGTIIPRKDRFGNPEYYANSRLPGSSEQRFHTFGAAIFFLWLREEIVLGAEKRQGTRQSEG